jgi:hypothetical protein
VVLETCEADAQDHLRKLLLLPWRVDSLPFRVACGVLHVPWPGVPAVPDGDHQRRSGERVAQGGGETKEIDAGS